MGRLHDARAVVGVQEIDMIGEPTDPKNNDEENEHLDNFLLIPSTSDDTLRHLSRGVLAPELPSHPGVADGHAEQGQQVGDGEEEHVVSVHG